MSKEQETGEDLTFGTRSKFGDWKSKEPASAKKRRRGKRIDYEDDDDDEDGKNGACCVIASVKLWRLVQ